MVGRLSHLVEECSSWLEYNMLIVESEWAIVWRTISFWGDGAAGA